MTNKTKVFGIYEAKTIKFKKSKLNQDFFGIIVFNTFWDEMAFITSIFQNTSWLFRKTDLFPFCFDRDNKSYSFCSFYSVNQFNENSCIYFIKNKNTIDNIKLIGYDKQSLYKIENNSNILPNQIALFPEDLNISALNLEEYSNHNLNYYDLEKWKETCNFLTKTSKPISNINYILPISLYTFYYANPLLNHLHKIPQCSYKFIKMKKIKYGEEICGLLETYKDYLKLSIMKDKKRFLKNPYSPEG